MSVDAGASAILVSLLTSSAEVPAAIARLFDAAGEQFGLFMKPIHARRIAQAESSADITRAKAKQIVKLINAEGKSYLQEIECDHRLRMDARINATESRRQTNLDSVLATAANNAKNPVTNERVSTDWLSRLVNNAQDVSDEQMQVLWGKILAGEVHKPGSFSLRTLDAIRNLTGVDAENFTELCSLVWHHGNTPYLIGDPKEFGFSHERLLSIAEAGLISNVSLCQYGHIPIVLTNDFVASYFGRSYHFVFNSDAGDVFIQMDNYELTSAGRELVKVAGGRQDDQVRDAIIDGLKNNFWSISDA